MELICPLHNINLKKEDWKPVGSLYFYFYCCCDKCNTIISLKKESYIYYRFQIDNNYYIYSNFIYNKTSLTYNYRPIIHINKYFPLDLSLSLKSQAELIFNKLNNLRAFV